MNRPFDAADFAARLNRVRSPEMRAFYERRLQAVAARERAILEATGHACWGSLPPADAFTGPIVIGTLPSGHPVGLDEAHLAGPLVLLIGPPGSGKTTLLNRIVSLTDAMGHTAIMFDTKETVGHAWGHTLPVLEPREAALGLQAPPSMPQPMYEGRSMTLLEQSLWLSSGSTKIRGSIEKIRELIPPGIQPCFRGVLDHMTRFGPHMRPFSKSAVHTESAVVALQRLCGDNDMFSGAVPVPWARRLSTSHAVRMRDLPSEAIRVAVMTYLEAYLGSVQSGERRMRHLWAFDDARVLAKTVQRQGQASVDSLTRYIDLAQSSGATIIMSLQHGGEVSPELISSASLVAAVGSASDLDVQRLRGRLGLDQEKSEALRAQPRFHAIVHFREGMWVKPFPVLLTPPPPIDMSRLEHERTARKQAMFSGIRVKLWSPDMLRYTPPSESKPRSEQPEARASEPKPGVLDPKLHRLLVVVLDVPHGIQDELGKKAGVRGRELTTCRDELQQLGFIKAHRLSRLVLLEATPDGAKAVGRTFKPLTGRGSYPHRWVQARWAAWMKQSCDRVEIEHGIPGLGILDGYAERSGQRLAMEAVVSVDTLSRSLDKLRCFDGCRVLVVPDQNAFRAMQEHEPVARIEVLTIRKLMAAASAVT